MTAYKLQLSDETIELAKKHGFDPTADIVPSAVGLPVSTGLTQEEYDEAVDTVLAASKKAVVRGRLAA
jgi:hypothetical protein